MVSIYTLKMLYKHIKVARYTKALDIRLQMFQQTAPTLPLSALRKKLETIFICLIFPLKRSTHVVALP